MSTIARHHSVLVGRVHIEHGVQQVDPDAWDLLTLDALDALERAFFGVGNVRRQRSPQD